MTVQEVTRLFELHADFVPSAKNAQVADFYDRLGLRIAAEAAGLGDGPVEIAELAGPRVNHVHLKDVDLGLAARLAASPAARPIVPVSRRKPRRLAWWFSAFVIGTHTSRRALQRAHMTSDI